MIVTHETKDDYKKISMQLLFASVAIFLLVTVVCYYSVFGLEKYVLARHFIIFFRETFGSALVLKLILIFISLNTVLVYTTGEVIEKERKKDMLSWGIASLCLFIMLMLAEEFFKVNQVLGVVIHTVSYGGALYCFLQWRKKEAVDLKKDRRLEIEAQFEQQRELVEHSTSVNIIYGYYYLGQYHYSWINVVNPFRGSLVGGTPGSGKSFAIIEEYIRQFVSKGFAMAMYDFKFPTLTRKLYNYFYWYQDVYKIKPSFYVVNFENLEYTDRCNPVNADSLHTIADASENARVLLYNINRDWIEKTGDFFIDSAIEYTTMLLWYLKLATEKYGYNVCSLPHLIALSTFESTELMFFILQEYDDLKAKMKPFSEALEKQAFEQLAGQVASAGISLSKINSKETNYVMSGDDFTFDLNDPLMPKMISLGNSPQLKETYSPIIGLTLSKLAKTMNDHDRCPSGFIIDEFPTVFIKGIDDLIGTGRSNKVGTLLGFQTFAQIEAGYGEKTAQNIIKLCGTRIMGQMMDDDAEKISNTIGKQKVLQRSYNYSTDEVSENQQVNLESIVPPERIAQFTQGVFCGVVADDFKYPEPNKVFYGEIKPPLELKKREDEITLPKRRRFIEESELDTKTKKFLSKEEEKINVLSEIMSSQPIEIWIEVLKKMPTIEKFNEYLRQQYDISYQYESIVNFLRLKDVFKDYIFNESRKAEKEAESIDEKRKAYLKFTKTGFPKEQIDTQMKVWVKEAFEFEAREKFLTDYTLELYNDTYRIIALELINLGIIDRLCSKENRQMRAKIIPLFKRILENKQFTETVTPQKYQEIINTLENAEN